eukprot:Tbor_TRINITY_DN3531_c0_g1::TRINITY_DN3531_c0_g1_i2::g.2811::m.2811
MMKRLIALESELQFTIKERNSIMENEERRRKDEAMTREIDQIKNREVLEQQQILLDKEGEIQGLLDRVEELKMTINSGHILHFGALEDLETVCRSRLENCATLLIDPLCGIFDSFLNVQKGQESLPYYKVDRPIGDHDKLLRASNADVVSLKREISELCVLSEARACREAVYEMQLVAMQRSLMRLNLRRFEDFSFLVHDSNGDIESMICGSCGCANISPVTRKAVLSTRLYAIEDDEEHHRMVLQELCLVSVFCLCGYAGLVGRLFNPTVYISS